MHKGSIFIVSAPSGAGKTTLCKKILKLDDKIKPSVSFTTRQPRKGEVNDQDYTFINEKDFRLMIEKGDFIEWAEVHGNLYGTSRNRLDGLMIAGYDILLDIDTHGAKQIKKSYKNGVFIFILPPSMDELRHRLNARGSNTKEDLERRLQRAAGEIQDYKMYDYVIVNDNLSASVKRFEAIIIAERLRSHNLDPEWIRRILK